MAMIDSKLPVSSNVKVRECTIDLHLPHWGSRNAMVYGQ
jgi:hypothetical protein